MRGLFMLWGLLLLCVLPIFALAGEILATRIWPAREYTRVTFESSDRIQFELLSVSDPPRIVVDIAGASLNRMLSDLSSKIGPNNPFISQIRLGRFKPGVTRVVFDLRQEVESKAFLIEPVGEYRHRLVVDLYPAKPVDPIASLLSEIEGPPSDKAPKTNDRSLDSSLGNGESPTSSSLPLPQKDKRRKNDLKLTRLVTIAIDAGHGGEDSGARGQLGTYEKDVTLAIARELKAQIEEQPSMRGVLIRDDDYFIPLGERVNRARRLLADLFVSVHADAYVRPHARGSSVFTLSEKGATSAAARWLAKRENESDLIGGVELKVADSRVKQVLFDLSQTATINDSLKLARAVLRELGEVNALHKRSVEQAGFGVLKAPDIPSILVETAFITNPQEEQRLRSERYQVSLASAILEGIKRYFAVNPPVAKDTKLAQQE